jgi:hypothetical protein
MPFCIKKILGCLILKLGGIGVDHGDADRHEHASAGTSVRRKRTGADELREQLDHFRFAGNFSGRPFVIFGHERRGLCVVSPGSRNRDTLAEVANATGCFLSQFRVLSLATLRNSLFVIWLVLKGSCGNGSQW